MNSSIILNQVSILFFVMLIGFYAGKRNIIENAARKKLSELLINITSPLFIISAFQLKFSHEILHNALTALIFSIAIHVLSILAGLVLYEKYSDHTKKIMKFVTVYSNCGFMGLPVLGSLFGKEGILYGSIYVAVSNLFMWTNGVMIFSEKKSVDYKKTFLNPGIISVLTGLVIFIFSIPLPVPIAKTMETVGSMTTPLSMLMIGAILADMDFHELFQGFPLYYATAVRLIIIPVITLFVMKWFGLSDVMTGACVLMVAMPAAAMSTIFSEMYNGDTAFASRIVSFSTLLSIATMPLIMALL